MPVYNNQWAVTGHTWAINHIARSLNYDRVRHAYLITGPAGIGKTTFARAFAQAVNCLNNENRPCGVCRACTLIARDSHADVQIIQSAGNKPNTGARVEKARAMYARPAQDSYPGVRLCPFLHASPR